MDNSSNHPNPPQSMEEVGTVVMRNAREGFASTQKECENWVRKSPTTAMLGAIAIGYLLNRVPLRAILLMKVRVLLALARPALLLFGAAKLYEFLQKRGLTKTK